MVRRFAQRAGTISTATLVAMPAVLLLVGLIVYVAFLRDAKTETQAGADAAALAAARALATDDLLTTSRERAARRIGLARNAALTLAQANFAAGEQLALDPNDASLPDGELVFGFLDTPLGEFQPAASLADDPDAWIGDRINAVQVTPGRSSLSAPFDGPAPDRKVRARATAMLDWCVVGFRPNNDSPVPLIPIGLVTDHAGIAPHGWHAEQAASDEWRFDPITRSFVPGQDGIPEIVVTLGTPPGKTQVPGLFLQIGVDSPIDTIRQVQLGVVRGDLEKKFGGGFVLDADNKLFLPGSLATPPDGSRTQQLLDEALTQVIGAGEPRIWPLVSQLDDDSGMARVTGWTGARVVSVARGPGGAYKLILQPAVVCHPSAVTEHGQTELPLFWTTNRTVCRVRLAE